MRFHAVCGSAVTLQDDRTRAHRRSDAYCHGIVFSDAPLLPKTLVTFELTHIGRPNLGRARIGLTTCDPQSFVKNGVPHFAIPYLNKAGPSWLGVLPRKHCVNGNRFTFYLDEDGRLQYSVNNVRRGIFLRDVTVSGNVWLTIDLYGNAGGVRLLGEGQYLGILLICLNLILY